MHLTVANMDGKCKTITSSVLACNVTNYYMFFFSNFNAKKTKQRKKLMAIFPFLFIFLFFDQII